MKHHFVKSLIGILVLGIISLSSCSNNDDDDDNNCTGQHEASWKVNGVEEKSWLTFHSHTVSLLNMSFTACSEPNNQLAITFIPYPPAAGTYDLKYGPGSPVTGMGVYIDESGSSGVHQPTNDTLTGVLTITAVDLTAKTLSGTFYFDALAADGSVIHITDGQITDTKYED